LAKTVCANEDMSDPDIEKIALGDSIPDDADLLRFLLENTPDRIYFKDLQGKFLMVSQAVATFFGVESRAALVGRSGDGVFTAEYARQVFEGEQEIIRTGKTVTDNVEKEIFADGRIGWSLTTKMPLRDGSGRVIGVTGISKDITRLKLMEEELRQKNAQLEDAERLQSTARLAAGLAHEIRNPLNNLSMAVEYIKIHPKLAADSTCQSVITEMVASIERADAVISELMESAGPGTLHLREISVRQLVAVALTSVLEEAAVKGVTLHPQVPADLPMVHVDPLKIERVIAGVLLNAVQVLGQGGQITIAAALGERLLDGGALAPGSQAATRLTTMGEVIVITIEDNGPGIPEDTLAKVFDPFFTTKEAGAGAGLGLTVCRKLLELHHGTIEVVNREEGGVRVTIFLRV